MTAKEYLLRYKSAYREAQDIELKITQLRLKYAAPSAIRYSDMPTAHDSNHDLSEYAARLDDLERLLIGKYTHCIRIEEDIERRIASMENEEERQVLRYRYTNINDKGRLMTWEEIAERIHYTRMSVTRMHGRALAHFPMDNPVL